MQLPLGLTLEGMDSSVACFHSLPSISWLSTLCLVLRRTCAALTPDTTELLHLPTEAARVPEGFYLECLAQLPAEIGVTVAQAKSPPDHQV